MLRSSIYTVFLAQHFSFSLLSLLLVFKRLIIVIIFLNKSMLLAVFSGYLRMCRWLSDVEGECGTGEF